MRVSGTGTSGVCEDRPGVQAGTEASGTDAYGLRVETGTEGAKQGEFVPIPQAWKVEVATGGYCSGTWAVVREGVLHRALPFTRVPVSALVLNTFRK